jgi:DNA modification methylase
MNAVVINGDCVEFLNNAPAPTEIHLTFLDPPFNQAKFYAQHDDHMPADAYWSWMQRVCTRIHERTAPGGAIYFMQREKNTEFVLRCLRETGWTLQNLIIWKKLTSAVPSTFRYGKAFQIIAYATKGERPRVFNRLRIAPPLPANYKYDRKNGMFVTDIWDDIRELTAGYFAGDEALRDASGSRVHKQQAPVALLLRIILTSSLPGDVVFDPFAGTGTTLVAAEQLARRSWGVELDPDNVSVIHGRLETRREADDVRRCYADYIHTEDLDTIWGTSMNGKTQGDVLDLPLFRQSDR